jgi:hypothetical protein
MGTSSSASGPATCETRGARVRQRPTCPARASTLRIGHREPVAFALYLKGHAGLTRGELEKGCYSYEVVGSRVYSAGPPERRMRPPHESRITLAGKPEREFEPPIISTSPVGRSKYIQAAAEPTRCARAAGTSRDSRASAQRVRVCQRSRAARPLVANGTRSRR